MLDEAAFAKLAPIARRAPDSFGMPVLEVEPQHLEAVVGWLRDEGGYALFLDVTAVDHPQRTPRFDVVYHFLCPRPVRRVRVTARVGEEAPTVPTLTGLYGSARFMEREAHDMYGIRFAGNDDLRPILLYEGFDGHPLRKDYPIEREQPIVEYRREPSGEGPPAQQGDRRQGESPGAADAPHPPSSDRMNEAARRGEGPTE